MALNGESWEGYECHLIEQGWEGYVTLNGEELESYKFPLMEKI